MVAKRNRKLKSGYTTGACSAAAAKAAVRLLLTGQADDQVEIPFPDGSRVWFTVHSCRAEKDRVRASIIKDAGDDPDVTNGAEIVAYVGWAAASGVVGGERIILLGGSGVGMVTKRGLAVEVGEPAINPVPQQMIRAAVTEVLAESEPSGQLEVTISVVDGEKLAEKTLNYRLGIVGGLSILGTTGIVRPVSAEAWTATIEASMAVAREAGLEEVVLSTGRTSERAVQGLLALPEEGYAMMGDYLGFSLGAAKLGGFKKIHLSGMWAKIMKAALETPQTHVRHGALEVSGCLELLGRLGADSDLLEKLADANTAREIYERLKDLDRGDLIEKVCLKAKEYAEKMSGLPVTVYLVASNSKVVISV
ncbi:MAG: cobalt-precorrin-5B (C(1))-methyltransferase [Desulfobulbaceae bacterium]|nr:cobalt-precorrin-5B (C(1))-methyltransferase [Desulfobulbaceae bacterium]